MVAPAEINVADDEQKGGKEVLLENILAAQGTNPVLLADSLSRSEPSFFAALLTPAADTHVAFPLSSAPALT